MMRHLLTASTAALLLAGCASPPQSLYLWEAFPRQQYDTLLRQASPNEQIDKLEAQLNRARDKNAAVPPGLRAHLGMMHLEVGNPGRAQALFVAEKQAFPESSHYMDRLLKRFDSAAASPQPTGKTTP